MLVQHFIQAKRISYHPKNKTIACTPAAEGTALVASGVAQAGRTDVQDTSSSSSSAPVCLSRHTRACRRTRPLQSSAVPFLNEQFRCTDIGKRSFSCAAPIQLGTLCLLLSSTVTISLYLNQLISWKTHFFNAAYS